MIISRNYLTTKLIPTNIDGIFSRSLENIELKYFVFYFSYNESINNEFELKNEQTSDNAEQEKQYE